MVEWEYHEDDGNALTMDRDGPNVPADLAYVVYGGTWDKLSAVSGIGPSIFNIRLKAEVTDRKGNKKLITLIPADFKQDQINNNFWPVQFGSIKMNIW